MGIKRFFLARVFHRVSSSSFRSGISKSLGFPKKPKISLKDSSTIYHQKSYSSKGNEGRLHNLLLVYETAICAMQGRADFQQVCIKTLIKCTNWHPIYGKFSKLSLNRLYSTYLMRKNCVYPSPQISNELFICTSSH